VPVASRPAFLRILPGAVRHAPRVAVEISGVLACREPVEDRPVGVFGQILDDPRYCVTVMARKPSELRFGLHVDEDLDALFGAVDTQMAQTIAPSAEVNAMKILPVTV
jgi:hypothetical protein